MTSFKQKDNQDPQGILKIACLQKKKKKKEAELQILYNPNIFIKIGKKNDTSTVNLEFNLVIFQCKPTIRWNDPCVIFPSQNSRGKWTPCGKTYPVVIVQR